MNTLCIRPVALLVVVVAMTGGCSVRIGNKVGRMDERGPATWQIESQPYSISKTYFTARGSDLAFVVEWTCSDCARQSPMSDDEAFALSRPVLWHAIESGEVARTSVRSATGRTPVNQLVSILTYKLNGKSEAISVPVGDIKKLFDFTWTKEGHTYRVTKPGYYFDQDAQALYFTVMWEAPELCGEVKGIADDRAAVLAMPILKEIVKRGLFRNIPIPADAAIPKRDVDRVGVAITCPCAEGSVACEPFGYRVARGLAEIAAAP